MPYIKNKELRALLDVPIKELRNKLIGAGLIGNVNYSIFKLFIELRKSHWCKNYEEVSRFLAELRECECEIRRRYLQPYEDEKIEANGDVE